MRIIRYVLGLTLAVAVTSVSSALLEAHMKVERTEPAANTVVASPPPHVQVFFSEAPDLAVSRMDITGPSDKTKLTGLHVMDTSLMAMVAGDMPDGAYTVSWQSAGPDGHIQKGEFTFSVKRK
jgi:methionine-rich copper-binding protein CopC